MTLNLLLSYAFHAKTDLARIRAMMPCGRIMIDSGAFTAYTKGTPIDIAAYAEYLEHWRGCWDHAITLDAIGDPVTTRRNTAYLHERGLPVVPVFTRGDSLAEFDAMLKDTPYICVGGLVGMPARHQLPRVAMLQRRAADQGGGIHALGVASVPILRRARPYSADSSCVSSGFQYGNVTIWTGQTLRCVPVKADRLDKLAAIRSELVTHGFPAAEIISRGRLPGGQLRKVIMGAGATAYACADEYLKRQYPTVGLAGGTHLYNVAIMDNDAMAMAGQDPILHGPTPPPVWVTASRHHICCERKAVA